MKNLKIITAFFAIATAVLLAMWVLGIISNESTKDAVVKVAAVSGIIAALSAILQLLGSGGQKR
ncbi:hypothetical protein KC878_01385 [Candidatus Saccharibacteria bacterium]|nr:hypothetical protein [Candidatus Saccharibacteria bacterium]MCB9821135.1 hypothetical protein [Candidatus Nomurabacteria bacterium]